MADGRRPEKQHIYAQSAGVVTRAAHSVQCPITRRRPLAQGNFPFRFFGVFFFFLNRRHIREIRKTERGTRFLSGGQFQHCYYASMWETRFLGPQPR